VPTPTSFNPAANVPSHTAVIADGGKNVGLRELTKYTIGEAGVTIYGDYRRAIGRYVVKEPELTEHGRIAYRMLMEELQSSPSVGSDAMTVDRLEKEVDAAAEILNIAGAVNSERDAILYRYTKEMLGWGSADVLFNDPDIEEITLPSPRESIFVIHRRFSEFNYMETNIRFENAAEADRFVHRMMHRVNRSPSVANPIVDGTDGTGNRYAVFLGEEASRGSTFTVRRISQKARSLQQLVADNMLSAEAAEYLTLLMRAKAVVFVIGPTGSGKTTLLNALVNEMPENWKYITIEETQEIQVNHRVWVSTFTRFSQKKEYSITIMDLVKASLRHRPDLLVVGESRGEEVREMFQAAATGHGLISTFHATDTAAMLSRMMGEPLSVKESFIQVIWAVVTVMPISCDDGSRIRRVIGIDEIVRERTGSYRVESTFRYDYAGDRLVCAAPEKDYRRTARALEAMKITGISRDGRSAGAG
jgi:flagellar protein FlaI